MSSIVDICVPNMEVAVVTSDPNVHCTTTAVQKLDDLLFPGMLRVLEGGKGCCLAKQGPAADRVFATRINKHCVDKIGGDKEEAGILCEAVKKALELGAEEPKILDDFGGWLAAKGNHLLNYLPETIGGILTLVFVFVYLPPKYHEYRETKIAEKRAAEKAAKDEAAKKGNGKDDDDDTKPVGGRPSKEPVHTTAAQPSGNNQYAVSWDEARRLDRGLHKQPVFQIPTLPEAKGIAAAVPLLIIGAIATFLAGPRLAPTYQTGGVMIEMYPGGTGRQEPSII